MEGSPVENWPEQASSSRNEIDEILADFDDHKINENSTSDGLFQSEHHPSIFGVSRPDSKPETTSYHPEEPFHFAPGRDAQPVYANGNTADGPQVHHPFHQAQLGNPYSAQGPSVAGHQLGFSPFTPTTPVLIIVEQPVERCRFRYKAEQGPHGSLKSAAAAGKKYKSCPKVKLENIHGLNIGNAFVMASLFTNEENPRPHVNDLWGNQCKAGKCRVELNSNLIASFPNLGIMRQKEKEVTEVLLEKYLEEASHFHEMPLADELKDSLKEKAAKEHVTMKDCLHAVRIGFQGYMTDLNTGQQMVTPMVLSDPVYNSQNPGFSELRIAEIDKSHGSCMGGDTIWMRCAAKVRRDQVRIRFHEPRTGWEAEGHFSANEVYEQILIIFKTPAYCDPNIRERVHVNLHLYRSTDGEYSPPIDFVYLPLDDGQSQQPLSQEQTKLEQEFSLTDLKQISSQPESAKQLEKILTHLWETHLQALWLFSSEGDPQSLVAACRQLIGWQNEDGTNALHVAVRNQQPFALKTLLNVLDHIPQKPTVINSVNYKKQTPLHQAIRFSDADCVHYLITSGAERTLIDSDGNTAAHYLADTFNEAIYKDVLFPPKDTVAAKQQLDLGHLNNAGQSAVHLAVSRLKMTLLENLIEAQAPLNVQERNAGKTPLHIAVDNEDADVVDVLVQNSADVNIQAADGSTPLHLAVQRKHEPIIVKLVQAGADVDLQSAQWNAADPAEEPDVNTMEDEEELRGCGAELVSARQLAEGNERLLKLLNGDILDPLLQPTSRLSLNAPTAETEDMESVPYGGARRKIQNRESQMQISPQPSHSRTDRATRSNQMEEERQRSPELPTAAMQDDLGSLDFITRLRLSKLLDENDKWEALVRSLGCDHMIDLIRVVCESSEESSSPTIVFLDQYEHVPGATVSSLLASLEKINEANAVELLMQRQSIHVASAKPPETMDAEEI